MFDIRSQKLADFVTWTAAHIKGDEKGDAQIFLDRLFQAFGQKGAKEAGGTYEDRVKEGEKGHNPFSARIGFFGPSVETTGQACKWLMTLFLAHQCCCRGSRCVILVSRDNALRRVKCARIVWDARGHLQLS